MSLSTSRKVTAKKVENEGRQLPRGLFLHNCAAGMMARPPQTPQAGTGKLRRLLGAFLLAEAIVAESIAANLVWVNNPWYNADDLGEVAGYFLACFVVPPCLGMLVGGLLWGIARLLAPRPVSPRWLALFIGAVSGILPYLIWFVAATFFDIDT